MAGINQKIISVPEMHSFEDVRTVLSQSLTALQSAIASQLPITNLGGARLTNVGAPQGADDAVTLKFLQAGSAQAVTPPSVLNYATSTNVGGSLGVTSYASVWENGNPNAAGLLPWNSELYDTNNYHDTVTNNSRLTAPASGLYLVGTVVGLTPGNSITLVSDGNIRLYLNGGPWHQFGGGSYVEDAFAGETVAGKWRDLKFTGLIKLNAGDYVEVVCGYTASGGTGNAFMEGSRSFFLIIRLA